MSWRVSGIVKGWTHTPTGRRLTRPEKLFLLVLSDYTNDETGCAWPSVKRLAKECLCSVRSIQYAVQRLCSEGLVTVEYRLHQSNLYRIAVDPDASIASGAGVAPGAGAVAPPGEAALAHKPLVNRKTSPPLIPRSGGQEKSTVSKETFLEARGGWIAVEMGNRKRLLNKRDWDLLTGARIDGVLHAIQRKGFHARIVGAEEIASWEEANAEGAERGKTLPHTTEE